MTNAVLLFIAIISFFAQVAFSIYYSIQIVNTSTLANQAQQLQQENQIKLEQLSTRYYNLVSINYLQSLPQHHLLTPITKKIIIP